MSSRMVGPSHKQFDRRHLNRAVVQLLRARLERRASVGHCHTAGLKRQALPSSLPCPFSALLLQRPLVLLSGEWQKRLWTFLSLAKSGPHIPLNHLLKTAFSITVERLRVQESTRAGGQCVIVGRHTGRLNPAEMQILTPWICARSTSSLCSTNNHSRLTH